MVETYFCFVSFKYILFLVNKTVYKIFTLLKLFLESIFNFSKFGYLLHDH